MTTAYNKFTYLLRVLHSGSDQIEMVSWRRPHWLGLHYITGRVPKSEGTYPKYYSNIYAIFSCFMTLPMWTTVRPPMSWRLHEADFI